MIEEVKILWKKKSYQQQTRKLLYFYEEGKGKPGIGY